MKNKYKIKTRKRTLKKQVGRGREVYSK